VEKIKRNAIRFLAAAFLLRVVLANLGMNQFIPSNAAGYLMEIFSAPCHAEIAYSFFSVEFSKRYDITFNVLKNGDTVKTLSTQNHGFRFFTHNDDNFYRLINFKANFNQDTLTQNLLARSVSVRVLNSFPESNAVNMSVSEYRCPTLEAYQHGDRGNSRQIYSSVASLTR
jgi:hypothetical protein